MESTVARSASRSHTASSCSSRRRSCSRPGGAPPSWLTAGLVLLVVLDVILVWGNRQVEPTMTALQTAAPPTIGPPLPELQQVDFGSATMGWLDLAAPALLGLLVVGRAAAALATGVAAGL